MEIDMAIVLSVMNFTWNYYFVSAIEMTRETIIFFKK